MNTTLISEFAALLLQWHSKSNTRALPWKLEKDPYKIWLSEVLLQQTRANQAMPYYLNFVKKFPTIQQLAKAPEQTIFKLWQGLGYYSRCRNMIATAKIINSKYQNIFPNTYTEILALKGVGPYTAAAIASFAYNLPYAVVDGNVYRILARVFGIAIATDSNAGKIAFNALAQQLLPIKKAGIYNQAIMDFGATICMPKKPLCATCIFNKHCIALNNNSIETLPFKQKKIIVSSRYFHYLIFDDGAYLYFQKRTKKDIWQDLYEFYLIENDTPNLPLNPYWEHINGLQGSSKQKLTHQIINAYFYLIPLDNVIQVPNHLLKISYKNISQTPLPKTIVAFLEANGYLGK
jgi:A/G-specific adenine glycosylase